MKKRLRKKIEKKLNKTVNRVEDKYNVKNLDRNQAFIINNGTYSSGVHHHYIIGEIVEVIQLGNTFSECVNSEGLRQTVETKHLKF